MEFKKKRTFMPEPGIYKCPAQYDTFMIDYEMLGETATCRAAEDARRDDIMPIVVWRPSKHSFPEVVRLTEKFAKAGAYIFEILDNESLKDCWKRFEQLLRLAEPNLDYRLPENHI
jgi:hypothetical protein